jgi:hypothetical protein
MEAAGIEEENRAEVAFMEEPLDPWRKTRVQFTVELEISGVAAPE